MSLTNFQAICSLKQNSLDFIWVFFCSFFNYFILTAVFTFTSTANISLYEGTSSLIKFLVLKAPGIIFLNAFWMLDSHIFLLLSKMLSLVRFYKAFRIDLQELFLALPLSFFKIWPIARFFIRPLFNLVCTIRS